MEKSFYQNVFVLTQVVPPSKDFQKYFRESMFEKPNTIGFLHVSHYLLTIYDAERTKKLLKWPLLCKKDESDYRTNVKDFLTSVASENPDIGFPQILASHLLHASGSKFCTIMWNLSTVCLRIYLKREAGFGLLAPKTGIAEDMSKKLLNNVISQSEKTIKDLDTQMNTGEEDAKKIANEIAESIKKIQEDLLLTRQNLIDLAPQTSVHPAIKSRLADPNDLEVMQIWQKSIEESLAYLKSKQKRLDEIMEMSNSVSAMVISIATADTNTLDGNVFPKIETNALSEIDGLDPETQIKLHRLYVNGVLSVEKLLEVFIEFLLGYHRYLEDHGFPDLSACEEQVHASCEDMKSMSQLFKTLCERMISITSEIKNGPNHKNDQNSREHMLAAHANNDIFGSVLLKSSPIININGNQDPERTDVNERLELTPIENMHKALFSRHRKMDDNSQFTKLRPKLLVSRINFDDTGTSGTSDRILSPANRSITTKLLNQSTASRSGKYSHLFSSYQKKSATKSNLSMISTSGLMHNSTAVDTSTCTDLYNISELRPHLTLPKYKPVEKRDMMTPTKCTPTKRDTNLASSTINDEEKSVVRTVLQSVINEEPELMFEVGRSPKLLQPEKTNNHNRRTSISDLVERYKRVRENIVDVPTYLENVVSDEN